MSKLQKLRMVSGRAAWCLAGGAVFQTAGMIAHAEPAPAVREDGDTEADVRMDEIVVEGQRLSLLRAIERKRGAGNISDVLASDDIGRLPDRNIGDALSRLPGVSTDQFEGEARFVNIRGLDASLNNLTLNGVQIATGDERGRDGRSAALDSVSTPGAAILEVIKTPTPDMDGVGIGGTINIITPSAFDRDAAYLAVAVDTTWSEVSDTSLFDWSNIEISGARRFGQNEQFGLFLVADYMLRDRQVRDRIDGTDWADQGGQFLPRRSSLTRFPTKRERFNLSGNLEYRDPGGPLSLYLRGRLTNDAREDMQRSAEQFDVRAVPVETAPGEYSVPMRLIVDGWQRKEENRAYSASAGGSTEFGANTVKVDLSYANAVSDRPLWNQIRFQSGDFPGRLTVGDSVRFEAADPAARQDPSIFGLQRIRFDTIYTEETIWSSRFDISRETNFFDLPATLSAGVKGTFRDKEVDAQSARYTPQSPLFLSDFDFASPGPGQPGFIAGGGFYQGDYLMGPAVNSAAVVRYFEANRSNFNFLEAQSVINNIEDDFQTEEDVYAAYVMGVFDMGSLTITTGARVEQTEYKSNAARAVLIDGELDRIDAVSESKSYTDVLPNLSARWAIGERTLLRGAITRSIGRPDFVAAAPIQEFEVTQIGTDENDQPIFTGTLDTGNPDLDRFKSNNFDVSFEFYPSDTGLLSIAAFHKEIKNPIFNRREIRTNTEFAGVPLQSLVIDTFENAESGRVSGVELAAQEQFTFLPGLLSGFGASVNHTFISSSSDVLGRDDKLPFFGQADSISNAALFFQEGGFEARLAWRRRSATLESLGGNADQDVYRDSYEAVDFRTGYRFNSGLAVFLDAWNLTNERPRIYQGQRSRFWGSEDTGRWVTVGVQWTLQ